MNLALVDYVLVGLYVLMVVAIGLVARGQNKTDDDFMLAGRKLTLPAMVMSLVTTWYGAILGVGEFVFGYGIVGWVTQGLMWYVAYFVFAIFMASKIRKSRLLTISDQIAQRIGRKSAFLGTILTYIMTSPAPYILSLGWVIDMLFGFGLAFSIFIGILLSSIYVVLGGFRAVVNTDRFQFALMYVGFGLLVIFCFVVFGGVGFLTNNLPETHLSLSGGLPIGTIFVWGLLAMWIFVDPNFYQRCYAAKSGATAKRGILWSIGFWFVFDMMTLVAGLYGAAAFPNIDPLGVYFVLADNVLPIFAKGVFVIAVLAIIMSTIDSFLFSSGTILARDFLTKIFPEKSIQLLTKVGIIITAIISLIIVASVQSVIGIVYAIGTLGVAALLLPMLLIFSTNRAIDDGIIVRGMGIALLSSAIWLAAGWANSSEGWPSYWLGLEPMYIGLIVNAVYLLMRRQRLFACDVRYL
jgi:solute:Na+ symporter, SSS family